jgi:hypothetical protein
LSADRSAGEIGAALDISPQTVQRHLHEIYLKLGLAGRKGRLAAARWYWEHVEAASGPGMAGPRQRRTRLRPG